MAVLCLLPFTLELSAQSGKGSIRGTVYTSDGETAAAVGLRLAGTKKQVISREDGTFQFRDVAAGTYEIEVFLLGHETLRQSITVAAGQQAEAALRLNASQKTLQEVIIAGGANRFARKESESATRMPLKNLENPQVYTVVGAELMKEQVIIDYKDAIKNVPGVNSTETVSNGRTSTIIRGFRTGSFIRNGLTANQLITVDPANLESVEVLKGPSGTLFGTGSVSYGGVVNRVTKRPFDVFRSELSLTAGSFGLNRITADINTPLNEDKTALLRVNIGRHASGSFQESGYRKNYFLAAAFSYKANEKLSFMVDLELFRNEGTPAVAYINPTANVKNWKEMEQYYFRTYYSNDLRSVFPGYNLYAQMNYKLSGKWTSTTLFSTGGVNARQQTQFTGTILNDSMLSRRVQRYSHNYQSIQVQQNVNGEFQTGGIRHRVLIGADYLADITQPTYIMNYIHDSVRYKEAALPILTTEMMEERLSQLQPGSHYSSHADRYGIYAADAINFTDRLLLLLSLRWDKVDNRGTFSYITGKTTGSYNKSSFSPKAGVVYQLVKNRLSVFANYMNGFSYNTGQDFNGGPFKPEQANQWEGGLKAELGGKLTATLSAYDITVTDKLRTDPDHAGFSIQDGVQNSKGAELELISNPVAGLNVMGGYGFNESVFKKSNKNVEGKRPGRSGGKHMANVWASYRLTGGKARGLGVGAGVYYTSEIPFDDANTLFFPAYALVNGTVFYDRPGYRIGLKLDNISNVRYWGPWGEPQPPRNYAVNLIVKL